MSRRNINRLGFMDFSIRDTTNETIFSVKGQNLGSAIRQLENFLEQKYGIKGFSAFDYKGYPKRKKKKEDVLKF